MLHRGAENTGGKGRVADRDDSTRAKGTTAVSISASRIPLLCLPAVVGVCSSDRFASSGSCLRISSMLTIRRVWQAQRWTGGIEVVRVLARCCVARGRSLARVATCRSCSFCARVLCAAPFVGVAALREAVESSALRLGSLAFAALCSCCFCCLL